MRGGWIIVAVLIVTGLIPALSLGAVSAIAAAVGCRVHEGLAQPCVIGGRDWGGALSTLGTLGWFFFLTAPIALAGFVLGIGLAVASLLRRARD